MPIAAVIDPFAVSRTAVVLGGGVCFARVTFFVIIEINNAIAAIMRCRAGGRTISFESVIRIPLGVIAVFARIEMPIATRITGTGFSEGFTKPSFLNDAILATVIGIVVFVVTFFAFIETSISTKAVLGTSGFVTRPSVFDLTTIVTAIPVVFIVIVALFGAFFLTVTTYGRVFNDLCVDASGSGTCPSFFLLTMFITAVLILGIVIVTLLVAFNCAIPTLALCF